MMWSCGSRFAVTGGRRAARAGRSLGVPAWQGGTQPGLRGQGTTAGTEHYIVSSPVPDYPLPSGNVATYLLGNASKWPERTALVGGKEVAVLPYSSGTTGKPKGAMISHDAYSSSTAIYSHPHFFPLSGSDSEQETFLAYLPFFHISGLLAIMATGLRHGVRVVTVPKFNLKTYVSNIVKYKVGMLHTVPSVLNFLMKSPEVNAVSMASVWFALCSAAPVSPTAAQVFQEKVDNPIIFQEVYGMTEAMATHVTPLNSWRLGSCGQTLPNLKSKVVDMVTGEALPANQDGEICFLTPSRMNGYINNEEATRATIDEEGWVHSGDIGFYDQDGFFSIVDRAKDLIKVKAFQVSPSELEDVILKHPKVQEVAVVGVPHERLGEAPRVYIVTSSPVSEKEIQDFMAERLAPHKQPAGGVVFLSDMPKNQTGKIMRRQLREMS